MALIAYLDSLELLLDPREPTDEDYRAFEEAIAESRARPGHAEDVARAMKNLAELGLLPARKPEPPATAPGDSDTAKPE